MCNERYFAIDVWGIAIKYFPTDKTAKNHKMKWKQTETKNTLINRIK